MIDYDSLPPRFSNECVAAIETANQEISGGSDGWFLIRKHDSRSELEIYFDLNYDRSLHIQNSPVFKSFIAGQLLENCPADRVVAYGFDSWQSEFDILFGFKPGNQGVLELEICPTETYPVFCDDL